MKMLLPWVDVAEYQGKRMLANQNSISPTILDSLALAHGYLSYQMSAYIQDDEDSRLFTRHFMRKPGLALRKSMDLNGFARVPDLTLLGGTWPLVCMFVSSDVCVIDRKTPWCAGSGLFIDDNQRWQLLATTAHSFVCSALLGRLIKENYSQYRTFHFRRYTSLCCTEVFDLLSPTMFPFLMQEYLATAFLEYLVTKLSFKLYVSLSNDRADTFGDFKIRRLEYRNQRGQDEDWIFDGDILDMRGSKVVFHNDYYDSIIRKVEVEALLSPANVEFHATPQTLTYGNLDGLSDAVLEDVQRRAPLVGRRDQTLYMEAFRSMLHKLEAIFSGNELVNQRSVMIQETIMALVSTNNNTAWPQIRRLGSEETEKLKVWRLTPDQPDARREQWVYYLRGLDQKHFQSMRRMVTNRDVMDLGAFECLSFDLDVLAKSWQRRQIANHFFSLSKRYPEKVHITPN